MANAIKVNFHSRVFKDQTNASDAGKVIQVGDTAYLKKRVPNGADVLETVTVTYVGEGGRTIGWDNGTTGVRAEDIVGISNKHNFACPGKKTYTFTLTESSPTTVKMAVSTVTIAGGVFTINVSEDAAANGIEVEFAQEFVAALNGYLGGTTGYASYAITGTAGTQVLTVKITGSPLALTAVAATGATVSAITVS